MQIVLWLLIFATGICLGFRIEPRKLNVVGGYTWALTLLGLLASGVLHVEQATWVFGVGAIVVPVVFLLLIGGAQVGRAIKARHG